MAEEVKIIFEIEGVQQSVSSIDELQAALKGVEGQAQKTEKTVEGVADAAKDMGKAAEQAGEASEGAIKVVDEVTGGLGTKVKEVGGGLKAMGKQAVTAFKGAVQGASAMGKALIATGIGAIVVAVGLLVAYWAEIKGFVNGVSTAQAKLLADTEAEVAARQESLASTEASENSLKLSGKSEREIRDLKIQQTNEVITATEALLEQQKAVKKTQVEAAARNQKITAGIIGFLTAPITMLLGAIDALTYGLEKVGVLEKATSLAKDFTMGTAKLLFDPEETAEEGDKTIAETEKTLATLKNKRDGYKLQNQAEEKKAREDKAAADQKALEEQLAKEKEAADKAAEYAKQKAQELADLKKAIREAEANTEAEIRAKELEDLDLHYQELITKAQEFGLATDELEASRLEAMNALKQKFADEDAARAEEARKKAEEDAEYQKQLAQAVQDAKLGVATAAFDTIAEIAGEESAAGKAFSVASATINTYQAATNALANTPAPPPFPQIAAGVAIAAGLLNVKKILAVKTPGGGGSGGGSVPTAPSLPMGPVYDPNAALQAASAGQTQSNQITLGEQTGSTGAPIIKAYVVSSEMSSQQEKDKKINDLARL